MRRSLQNCKPCLSLLNTKKIQACLFNYRVFSLNIVFFPKYLVIFLNSASSAAALVFYLPGVCLTPRKNGERAESGIF